jgi:hypothetical protein
MDKFLLAESPFNPDRSGVFNFTPLITQKIEIMKTSYKNYTIEKAKTSHCAFIYKGTELIKCIAGDILGYLQDNAIEKAKKYIDNLK